MATGAIAVGPLGTAYAPLAGPLASASEPAPSSAAWTLVAGPATGARGAYTAPVVAAGSVAGRLVPLHDGQWFELVHVLPRRFALGNIVFDRLLVVEVWNACRRGYRLWDIDVAGNPGVGYSGVTPPVEFNPFHSELHAIEVSAAGSDPIDNVLTWTFRARTGASTFVPVAIAGADVTLSGSRMLVFTARPDGVSGIVERYGYLTDVFAARNGAEQRRQLRELPLREQRATHILANELEALDVMAKLFIGGRQLFGVPFWPDAAPLTAPVAGGASEVFLATAGRTFEVGGTALLWRDQWTNEAFTVLSIAADRLVVDGTITGTFAQAGTVCAPLLPMRLVDEPSLGRESGTVATVGTAFLSEGT